jgi:electron transfer flavoprotein alpha subunit
LNLPFVGGVRKLDIIDRSMEATCEHDDGWVEVKTLLPAVLSCAERLCEPAKARPELRRTVSASLLSRLGSRELGPGPWGEAGSRTIVGQTAVHEISRAQMKLDGPVEQQVDLAVRLLLEAGAIGPGGVPAGTAPPVPPPHPLTGPPIIVIVEPGRFRAVGELLGAAASLATDIGGHVVAVCPGVPNLGELSDAGADRVVSLPGAHLAEDVALGVSRFNERPSAVLVLGTLWGREVASRLAVRLDAGLTGDAIGLEVKNGRLLAFKPAFGGRLVASISASSDTHLVTIRPGVLPVLEGRGAIPIPHTAWAVEPERRIEVVGSERNDDIDRVASATTVVGVGRGVLPDEYPELDWLLTVLDAELGATRKVTDNAWLPHARQIGITGRSIRPQLYVAIGLSGSFNHMIGVRAAKFVLAINSDPSALCFDACDVGIVGDWREVVPALSAAIAETLRRTASTLS